MYLVIACVLSVFDVRPVLDDDGNPRIPKVEFESPRYVFLEPSIHTVADVDYLVVISKGQFRLAAYFDAKCASALVRA